MNGSHSVGNSSSESELKSSVTEDRQREQECFGVRSMACPMGLFKSQDEDKVTRKISALSLASQGSQDDKYYMETEKRLTLGAIIEAVGALIVPSVSKPAMLYILSV